MFSNKKKQCEAYAVCGRQVAAWLENRKIFLLFPGQYNLATKIIKQYNKKLYQCVMLYSPLIS